jgi:predicted dehydrogenase
VEAMRILITGLGAIGAGSGMPVNAESHLSLAKGLGFEIVGGVDPNPIRRAEFKEITGSSTYPDLESTIDSNPEIVVIASNQESHLECLRFVTKKFPNASVICEKPFGSSDFESKAMIELIKDNNLKCYVNYTRQFSKGYKDLKMSLEGELSGGNVIYSHGLARSCSHFIRLSIGLFGAPKEVERLEMLTPQNPSFALVYENGARINFIGVPDSNYRVAEFMYSTTEQTLLISEAMNWKLLKANSKDAPEWARDLKIIATGDFSGGLQELYRNILEKSTISSEIANESDCLPNRIISKVLSNV